MKYICQIYFIYTFFLEVQTRYTSNVLFFWEVHIKYTWSILKVFQPFCFHWFPRKPVNSTHAYFAFYRHVGLLNQWKGVKIVCFHADTFKSKKTSCKVCVFTRRRFLLLQFPVFFCQVQQKVFLTLVTDVFLQ